MEKTPIQKITGQSGIVNILLYLYDKKEAILSDFIFELKISAPTVLRAINILKETQLIDEEQKYNRRFFRLTDRGVKVAMKMREIEKILEE